MQCNPIRWLVGLTLASLMAANVQAAGVSVKFDLSQPSSAVFPADYFTVADSRQATGLRINLPTPDGCPWTNTSDCHEVRILNQLDGFNLQARITVPFTGPIDPATLNGYTVYLINGGEVGTGHGRGERISINRMVWDPVTNTAAFEPNELLKERTQYLVVVTDGVRDADGDPLERGWYDQLNSDSHPSSAKYREHLRIQMWIGVDYLPGERMRGLALFTTQTAAGDLVKIRNQIKATAPAPIDFNIAQKGTVNTRALFTVRDIDSAVFKRQNRAMTHASPFDLSPLTSALANLRFFDNVVDKVAYGRFSSPNYLTEMGIIPTTPTKSGQPRVQSREDRIVQIFLPKGPMPAGGWPVALFGHGLLMNMFDLSWNIPAVMASNGIATVMINVVGHGGGSEGTLELSMANQAAEISVPAGGRGIDQNKDGNIDGNEGLSAIDDYALLSYRDGLRQQVADLMQLVRQIEMGVDATGDGIRDLDPDRIYYAGHSLGGIYGTMLTAVEPKVRAGALVVPGGPIVEAGRLGGFRFELERALNQRNPKLTNDHGKFVEDMPLRNEQPKIVRADKAMEIQKYIDRSVWSMQSGSPVAFAPYLRKRPLAGNRAKPVIFQIAKGDSLVPNPTSSTLIRAGDLKDRTTYYRTDEAAKMEAVSPSGHMFLIDFQQGRPPIMFAIAAQRQIAKFFTSDGAVRTVPEIENKYFETPIKELPEQLNFIQ
ncbi:MAG TPA: alpha/beta fold hydrolase [Pseudomonas xinjiangensis]|uniref:Alpha/beta fold hydrolase n=2 Tax=root TaxID=1 RepID=A0A7V1FTZ3_9GAMM|nr:alpha/beta fold hydrolase [Halopseudomonas xinjiangensis]HEC46062.1 alpha/beta fold hydrolase [Halopseudomonas xinjiangensis]